MAFDLAALKTQFGSYYMSSPDNMARLRKLIYQKIETAQYFTDRPTSDTYFRSTLAMLDRVVQPFQKAWTPIGTLTFTPNEGKLFKLKIDKEEYPDDLEETYVGFLADLETLDRSQWPFVRWFIEEHIMPQKQSDLEISEYFKGVYAAPTQGTAGAAGTAMDGIRKIIRTYNTAGQTNMGGGAIATGAPSATNSDWVTQVEEYVDDIPELYRESLDYVFMSKTNRTKYRRGKRDKYNINYMQANDLLNIEDYPGIQIVGLKSMEGSDMIWSTTKMNRIRPIKKAALADTMKVETLKRALYMFTDWWEVLTFEAPQIIFHNDQDLS